MPLLRAQYVADVRTAFAERRRPPQPPDGVNARSVAEYEAMLGHWKHLEVSASWLMMGSGRKQGQCVVPM